MCSQSKAPVTLLPLGLLFFFSSRRRHTICGRDWSSDVCSSDLIDVDIVAGTGPVVAEPVRGAADVARLSTDPDLSFVAEAVRLIVAELGPTPLIGFAGEIGRASCRERGERSVGAGI